MPDGPEFNRHVDFEYGIARQVSARVRRLVANNPGKMTFTGTNCYLVGTGEIALIDPGPDTPEHIETLMRVTSGETISHILVTHTHMDHSGATARLKELTGAATCGFGPCSAPRGFAGDQMINSRFVDSDFNPDLVLAAGDKISGNDWSLEAVHTPGHAPDHLCFALAAENALFSGDHVMGWNTSIVAPPEGNMKNYIESLKELLGREETLYWPGHGARIKTPHRTVKAYILHRQWRESAIFQLVATGHDSIGKIMPKVYRDLDRDIMPVATLSVLAHLEYLVERGIVSRSEGSLLNRVYKIVENASPAQ